MHNIFCAISCKICYDKRMWNGRLTSKKNVIAMTPVRLSPPGSEDLGSHNTVTERGARPQDTVRAGTGALSFILGTQHKLLTGATHGSVDPPALVVTCPSRCDDASAAELSGFHTEDVPRHNGVSSNPITVHIGFERRLESSAISGPQHVLRTLALSASELGTRWVTVEPGWERIIWEAQ